MESNPRRRRCREIVRAASLARDRSSAPGSTFGRSAVWLNRVVATSLQSPSTTTATTMMRTTMTTMITGSECRRATSHDFVERARALVYTHSRVRSNSFHTDAALIDRSKQSRDFRREKDADKGQEGAGAGRIEENGTVRPELTSSCADSAASFGCRRKVAAFRATFKRDYYEKGLLAARLDRPA